MNNKYALGTIVGAALLGLAKTKGSMAKIKKFYFFKHNFFHSLPVVLKDPSKLADSVVKINCQGDEETTDFINSQDFSMAPLAIQQRFIRLNEEHYYCSKNASGECISFLPPNQNEVKKAAEKILKLITDSSKERITVRQISNTKIENVYYHQEIDKNQRQKENVLNIRKPYDKWYEHNLKNICDLITPQIHRFGNFTMQITMPFNDTIRLSHHPNTDAGKKELSAEIYKIIDERFGKFGFTSNRNMRPFDFNLNFNYLTKSHLMIEKDGEWIPYKKPESAISKLRKR